MQPSSLIFLVIIAIWAAYFIQHWVRRREHLATARSVDRFSESMRVLEHRSALPVADLSAPQPRSYAVSPARTARPEILVKRAGQAPAVDPADHAAPEAAPAATARPASRLTRRTRGLTLLGSLAAILVAVGLAAFGVVPWVAVLVPVGAFAGALVWVRQGVRAEQAARRAAVGPMATGRPQARAAHAARPGQDARRTGPSSASSSAGRRSVRENAPAPAPAAERQAPSSADDEPGAPVRESFYDVEAAERPSVAVDPAEAVVEAPAPAHAAPAVPLVDEDDIPLTWDPVPVPRPTYTMKAVASRTPAPPVASGVPPELAEPAYDEPVRRVAGA